MRGVAFDGLDQIGNEIVALFELNVDVGKGLVGPLAHSDEAVVDADRPDHEDDNDAKDNPAGGRHEKLQIRKTRVSQTKLVYPPARSTANGNEHGVFLEEVGKIKKDPEPEPGVS
jgi:hypothetical protein